MSQTIAILTPEGSMPSGLCQAFTAYGCEVVHIPCNPYLPVALQEVKPSFAVISQGDTWGNPASIRELLEAMDIAVLGPSSATIRNLYDLGNLYEVISGALSRGEIDASLPRYMYMDSTVARSLVECGQLKCIEGRFDANYPLVLCNSRLTEPNKLLEATCLEELAERIAELAGTIDGGILIKEPFRGTTIAVPILGNLDDILMLPPVEIVGSGNEHHVPVRLSSLSDDESDAQGIRSEIERCALDAYIVSGCREAAVITVGWDGGKPSILNVDPQPSFAAGGLIDLSLEISGISREEVAIELAESVFDRL